MSIEDYVRAVMDEMDRHDKYQAFIEIMHKRSSLENLTQVVYASSIFGYSVGVPPLFVAMGIIESAFITEMNWSARENNRVH